MIALQYCIVCRHGMSGGGMSGGGAGGDAGIVLAGDGGSVLSGADLAGRADHHTLFRVAPSADEYGGGLHLGRALGLAVVGAGYGGIVSVVGRQHQQIGRT